MCILCQIAMVCNPGVRNVNLTFELYMTTVNSKECRFDAPDKV